MKRLEIISSQTSAAKPTSALHITAWPEVPQLEIWTEDWGGKRSRTGPSVVFRGEDVSRFLNELAKLKPEEESDPTRDPKWWGLV